MSEWSHHHDYMGHEDLFCIVLLGYFCQFFLISSASLRSWRREWQTASVLFWAHLCMKSSFGMSNFLEEIFSISHSVIFLYFFALISEEGFLISPCFSLELCIQMGRTFLFSFTFSFCFSAICKALLDTVLPFCISFSWGWSWSPPPVWCHESPSIVLQVICLSDLIPWIYLSLPLYNRKGFDLGHSDFPYFLQFKSEFCKKEFMIWAIVSLIFTDCIELFHLSLQRI